MPLAGPAGPLFSAGVIDEAKPTVIGLNVFSRTLLALLFFL